MLTPPTPPPPHNSPAAAPVAPSEVVTGPMRLLFPRVPGGIGEAASFPFSLLGEWWVGGGCVWVSQVVGGCVWVWVGWL